MTKTNTKKKTMTKTNTFSEHLQGAILETCDLDLTKKTENDKDNEKYILREQIQRQRQIH